MVKNALVAKIVADRGWKVSAVGALVAYRDHPRGSARSTYRNNSDLKTLQRARRRVDTTAPRESRRGSVYKARISKTSINLVNNFMDPNPYRTISHYLVI